MTSWAAEAPDLQVGDVLKIQAKPSKLASKTMGMAGAFSVGGTVLMLMLAICPIWSAANLLGDFNYVFWAGHRVPTVTIVVCFALSVSLLSHQASSLAEHTLQPALSKPP